VDEKASETCLPKITFQPANNLLMHFIYCSRLQYVCIYIYCESVIPQWNDAFDPVLSFLVDVSNGQA
jgi:hypothetical protein